jgi:hypothetical protein
VAYDSGGLIETTQQAEGILPWETSVTLKGGDVALIRNVEILGGTNCSPSCTILVDGSMAVSTSAPTCQRVIGWMW